MYKILGLDFAYREQAVLQDVSFSLPPKGLVGLVGPNGAGKSTLLKLLAGLLIPGKGTVYYADTDWRTLDHRERARRCAYLPQDFAPLLPVTVRDLAMLGRHPWHNWWQGHTPADREAVAQALTTVGMDKMSDRWYHTLSGGEKQRALLGMALARKAPVLLLDETLSQTDWQHRVELVRLLEKEAAQCLVVLVTHDFNLAAEFCGHLLVLQNGRLREQGRPEQVLTPDFAEVILRNTARLGENPFSGNRCLFYVKEKNA